MATYICVDCESDGEIPNKYSMVCFGAVIIEPTLSRTFYGKTKPISELWKPDALAISGFTREQHLTFDDPEQVMLDFEKWILSNSKGKPVFISDNPAYDWSFINYYMHFYLGRNIFGYSARRIGDLYCGMIKDSKAQWKHLRTIKHDHHPVNDAKGNAQAVLKMKDMGLKINFE